MRAKVPQRLDHHCLRRGGRGGDARYLHLATACELERTRAKPARDPVGSALEKVDDIHVYSDGESRD